MRIISAAIVIVMVGLAAYSNSFTGIFVFDDEPAIAQNGNLRSLWPLTTAMSAPPGTTLAGRPVSALSFAIDHARSGGSLSGYHATNLAIHLAATLFLFGVTRRALTTTVLRDRFSSSATTLALIVALVFVVHPLQTGSVTYLVQRVESLMGVFYLGTLYCAIRALDTKSRARVMWTGASILACALGMATKEVMATAPLMVMLWDYQFAFDRTTKRRLLYFGLASTWIIPAVLLTGAYRTSSVGFGFSDWPWWRYLATQAGVVTHYLRLAVIPTPLVLDYGWPAATSMTEVALPGIFLCALLVATIWGLMRRVPAAFAGAWCFVILAPSSSVIPIVTEVAAEHRMYLPVAGVIALVVCGLFALGSRATERTTPNVRRALAAAGLVAATAVIILFARMTYARNLDYHDYDRIWSDTIAKRPHNARARNNYATSLLTTGRYAEAEPHLRVAVEEQPSFAEAEANLGVALSAQGRLAEGEQHLLRAIALRPDYVDAHRNLAETYGLQHRLADAAAHYAKALEYQPDDVRLLNRLAWILATANDASTRDGARARTLAEHAVTITRRQDAVALDALAAACAELGEFDVAAATAYEAMGVARRNGNLQLSSDLAQRSEHYSRRQKFWVP
jgi:Flp pilus assembly protein TadD